MTSLSCLRLGWKYGHFLVNDVYHQKVLDLHWKADAFMKLKAHLFEAQSLSRDNFEVVKNEVFEFMLGQ